jgi:glucokinase
MIARAADDIGSTCLGMTRSPERLVRGQALAGIHAFINGDQPPSPRPRAIVAAARAGEATAGRAIRRFVSVLTAHAGRTALAFQPLEGLLATHLAEGFAANGHWQDNARRIPLWPGATHDAGLDGAVKILKGIDRAEA